MHQRREKILDAATQLLVSAPDQFSMRALAAKASVSVRTIYNLVGDQAQILTLITNRPAEDLLQLRRKHNGSAFNGLLLQIDLIRNLNLRNDAGLASIRALRLLDPAKLNHHVKAVVEKSYLPDLTRAMKDGDLTGDIRPEFLAKSLIAFTSQALGIWAIDGISEDFRERVALGLIMTLLMATERENRHRCLSTLQVS